MLVRLLVGWALLALTFFVVTKIVPGIQVTDGVVGFLVIALVFGLVNSIVGPILRAVTLPLRIVTLGTFSLVLGLISLLLNAVLLELIARLTPALTIDSVWSALVGALLISIISALFNAVIGRAVRMAT